MSDLYLLKLLLDIDRKLDAILNLVHNLESNMASDLTALTAQVEANVTVEQSAITLLQGLATQLAALQNDPAAIAALATQLQNSAQSLSAAVLANTPTPPTPPAP